MPSLEIALIFGIILALIQYHANKMSGFYLKHRRTLSTFSAGIVLSYLVLQLLPAIYQVQGRLSKFVYLSMLGGIALVFLLDKHISRHRFKYKIRSEIREEHAVSLFVYHILLGIAFIGFSESFLDLLLFFIPLALFGTFSSFSIKEIYDIEREADSVTATLSGSILIGMILATIIPVSRLLYFPLLGLMAGSILYIILNDVFREPERKNSYFFFGILIYSAIIGLMWWIF